MLDALAYLNAARAVGAPGAVEVSGSGVGAHVWIFFTGAVSAVTARQIGTGLVREAIAIRGHMIFAATTAYSLPGSVAGTWTGQPHPGRE